MSVEQEFDRLLRAHYTHLHAHPELALAEYETTAYVKEQLGRISGVEILPFPLETGVWARIVGQNKKNAKKAIALRADIDALPIMEESGVTYASEYPGKMHACGHDFHTSALLGAASILSEQRDSLPGNVYLLFQPAEESSHGGEKVAATGILQEYGISEIYALHVKNGVPVGTIEIAEGPFSATVDRFTIRIRGKGGHGSAPQNCLDPVPAAARLITSLQEIIGRKLTPGARAVISVTRIASGSTWNVIPEEAYLEGTIRSFEDEVTFLLHKEVRMRVKELEAEGYETECQITSGCPATRNDTKCARLIEEVAFRNGITVKPQQPEMGGEDFSCFQKLVPGALFHVGTGDGAGAHNPKFRVDLDALQPAAVMLADIAVAALAGS